MAEALQYNTFFESFVCANVAQKDAGAIAAKVFRQNKTIKRLIIKNCGVTFNTDFGSSLYFNTANQVSYVFLF